MPIDYRKYKPAFVAEIIKRGKLETSPGKAQLALFLDELYEHEFGEKEEGLLQSFSPSPKAKCSEKDIERIGMALQEMGNFFDKVKKEERDQGASLRHRENFDILEEKKKIIKIFENIVPLGHVDQFENHYIHGVGNEKKPKNEVTLLNDQLEFISKSLVSMQSNLVSFVDLQKRREANEAREKFYTIKEPLQKIFKNEILKAKDLSKKGKVFITKDELNKLLLDIKNEKNINLNSRLVNFIHNKEKLPIDDYRVERDDLIKALLLAARKIDSEKRSGISSFFKKDKKNDLEARLTRWFNERSGMKKEDLEAIALPPKEIKEDGKKTYLP